jgi:sugar phosphate isomerase/epimerase
VELGLSTGAFFHDDLLRNLPAVKRAGFRNVEVCVGALKGGRAVHYDWRDAAYTERLAAALREHGLKAPSLHAPYSPDEDPAHPDAARRKATLETLIGVARVLKTLGGRTMVVHIGVNEFNLGDAAEKARRIDHVRKLLPPLVEEVASLGLRLALENLLPHILGGEVEVLLELLSPYPKETVGVCFDTSHGNLWGRPTVYEALEKSLPRLFHTHLSDNKRKFDDHFPPGDGDVDWVRVADILRRARYDGALMLEVFRDPKQSGTEELIQTSFARAQEHLKL